MIQKGSNINILGAGHVMYLDHLGSDQRIAEAARTSYQSGSKGPEADAKLIRYMFLHGHTSPFEQCNISFEINMPIFCMRQFVRHRMFRLNEWSGRYTELPDVNYMPPVWRVQSTDGNKQGSQFDPDPNFQTACNASAQRAFKAARKEYDFLLSVGAAKELARIVLPLATFTQIHVNCDLNNLLKFLYLRTDSHAQLEMQEIAFAMLQIVHDLFPVTARLFDEFVPKMVERPSVLEFSNIWVTQ